MNGYLLRITSLTFLTLGACGTGKFSEDFSTEIQRDCIETVGCYQTGQIETCIAGVGDRLNGASTSKQQFFVDAVYRCQSSRACEWVTCVESTNQAGFAAMRLNEITNDCQQRTICRGEQAASEDAVRRCIQETGNSLNVDLVAQGNFDARYARCATQQGCAYSSCQ